MAYLELPDIKVYLGIALADTSEDTLLATLLAAAQSAIEELCGRSFEAVAETRYFAAENVQGQILHLDGELLTVNTLTNGDGTIIPSMAYMLLPLNTRPYRVIRLKSAYQWQLTEPDALISIAGIWGYSVAPPAVVRQAAREYIHYLYHSPDALKANKQGAARADMLPVHIGEMLSSLRKRSL